MSERALLSNANVQAWLRMIRHAEGTAKYANPWGTAFTGAQYDNNRPHPQVIRGRAGGYRSDAHGAYQFLSTTWRETMGGNLPMTRENQEIAAIRLMRRRGVDPTKPLSRELVHKLAPEWASLPTMQGKSYYGQPVKPFEEVQKVWAQQPQQPQQQQQQPGFLMQGAVAAPKPSAPRTGPTPLERAQQAPKAGRADSPAQLIRGAVEGLGIPFPFNAP